MTRNTAANLLRMKCEIEGGRTASNWEGETQAQKKGETAQTSLTRET